jgi:hypothetical protein
MPNPRKYDLDDFEHVKRFSYCPDLEVIEDIYADEQKIDRQSLKEVCEHNRKLLRVLNGEKNVGNIKVGVSANTVKKRRKK